MYISYLLVFSVYCNSACVGMRIPYAVWVCYIGHKQQSMEKIVLIKKKLLSGIQHGDRAFNSFARFRHCLKSSCCSHTCNLSLFLVVFLSPQSDFGSGLFKGFNEKLPFCTAMMGCSMFGLEDCYPLHNDADKRSFNRSVKFRLVNLENAIRHYFGKGSHVSDLSL